MRIVKVTKIVSAVCVLVSCLVLGQPATVHAQTPAPQVGVNAEPAKPSLEIYGFAMLDIGHDFKQIHPDWYDTLRLTRLPKVANEFGEDNNTFMGVRQSRLGVRSYTPTDLGPLKTIFEFELFGTGVDSGQTTFRLRHAWGELGPIGAGQVLESVHGSGRLPELPGILGSHRSSVVPQRAAPLLADRQRSKYLDARARPPGRQRRPGGLFRSYRARRHQGALPAAGLCRRLQARGQLGPRPNRRNPAAHQLGRHPRRRARPLGRRHRVGMERQLGVQRHQEQTSCGWHSPSAKACRTK